MTDKESEKNWKEIFSRIESAKQWIAKLEKEVLELRGINAELVTWIEAEYIKCREYFSVDGCKKCRKKKNCDVYKMIGKAKGMQG